jgi:hypothetical protein
MIDEYTLLSSFLEYCKNIIGGNAWENRFKNIENYHKRIKTKKINLDESPNSVGRTFVAQQYLSKDLSMWYLYNVFNYIHHPELCDLGLLARVAPKILRISELLPILINQKGFEKKMALLLEEKSKDIENIVFEILVGCMYLRKNAKNIEFLYKKSEKHPDILVDYNGPLYIECKRKAKESDYSKKERECWYEQYLPIQDYLNANKISLVMKVNFHKELNTYKQNYLFSNIIEFIRNKNYGIVIDNDELTIEL